MDAHPDHAAPGEHPDHATPGEHPDIDSFWQDARIRARLNPASGYFGPTANDAVQPPAWSFGGTPEEADRFCDLVLAGTRTATASALWDHEAGGETLPHVGELGIVLDGRGRPRALLVTTEVRVVPFRDVDADHAAAEGEGDGSRESWRRTHRELFTTHATHDRGFSEDMPVVLERFRVLVPGDHERGA